MKTFTKKIIGTILVVTTLLSACEPSDIAEQVQTSPKETIPGQISHSKKENLVSSLFDEDLAEGEPNGEPKEVGLTLYVTPEDYYLKAAIPIFKRKYPDIVLEVIGPENDDFANAAESIEHPYHQEIEAMFTSIMAGKGPDILTNTLFANYTLNERLIENGAFADMSEFYDSDETFHHSLNRTVMDAGVYDGKRYLFPLDYEIPLLLSSERVLKENNFNIENNVDFLSFLEETKGAATNGLNIFNHNTMYTSILTYYGGNPLDLEKNTIDLSFPEFKASLEWMKSISDVVQPYDSKSRGIFDYSIIFGLRDNKTLFLSDPRIEINYSMYERYCVLMLSIGETPALVPIRNANGGITARAGYSVGVSANCKNFDNAYKFVQVLLSPDVQYDTDVRLSLAGISVVSGSMSSLARYLSDSIFGHVEGFPSESARPKYSEEMHDNYMKYVDEIDSVVWKSWTNPLYEFANSYINDEITYEECVKRFEKKIELWLSE